jgi:hypothetical protein
VTKSSSNANEIREKLISHFWPGEQPEIRVFPHPTVGWDVTVGSSRSIAIFEAQTVANFLRPKIALCEDHPTKE